MLNVERLNNFFCYPTIYIIYYKIIYKLFILINRRLWYFSSSWSMPSYNSHLIYGFILSYLIIPTATVFFIYLTANLPSAGISAKVSTGFFGTIWTIPVSPDFRNSGFSYMTTPVLISFTDTNWLNFQAMGAVRQSNTRVYPFEFIQDD